MENFGSQRALSFTESVIREMTRVCVAHQGINLAQGFPDFPAPMEGHESTTFPGLVAFCSIRQAGP
jgi:hypothetical protein